MPFQFASARIVNKVMREQRWDYRLIARVRKRRKRKATPPPVCCRKQAISAELCRDGGMCDCSMGAR